MILAYVYQMVYICLNLWNVETYYLCTFRYTLLINGRDSAHVQVYISKDGRSAELTNLVILPASQNNFSSLL